MTIQELIEKLQLIEDKSQLVHVIWPITNIAGEIYDYEDVEITIIDSCYVFCILVA